MPPPPIPVFLLKTKSSPTDAYEELFAATATTPIGADVAPRFEPSFVPVLEHRFDDEGVAQLKDLLRRRRITNNWPQSQDAAGARYGGLIFTSQRAVEAFAKVVAAGDGTSQDDSGSDHNNPGSDWPHLQNVPVYSVGPATTRALNSIPQQPPLQVFGEHTGNGEDLAYYIQEHYLGRSWLQSEQAVQAAQAFAPPPLLFVVGEKRRDIIPRVLMGDIGGSAAPRIQVDQIVAYGTGIMPSFADDFQKMLDATQDRATRWVVVFSPTGCDSMLAALDLLDPETGRARVPVDRSRSVFVATIGPTTRSYLRDTFGFDPDVSAAEPSPRGILEGILRFMAAQTTT